VTKIQTAQGNQDQQKSGNPALGQRIPFQDHYAQDNGGGQLHPGVQAVDDG